MKLRNKLILSCAALAACATTMVSTTFAWYTTNKEVTATDISGESSAGTDALLLITKDPTASWGQTVTLSNTTEKGLAPVEFVQGTEEGLPYYLNQLGSTEREAKSSDSTNKTWYEDTVYIKNSSGKAGNLHIEFTAFAGHQTSLPTKAVIGANHKFIGIGDSVDTYTVDMLRTLCMEVEVSKIIDGGKGGDLQSDVAYDLEALGKTTRSNTWTDSLSTFTEAADKSSDNIAATGTYNAHLYRNSVMGGKAITTTADTTTLDKNIKALNSSVSLGVMPLAGSAENTYLKVTIKFFINGWDLACFDAVQEQNFTAALKFTLKDE